MNMKVNMMKTMTIMMIVIIVSKLVSDIVVILAKMVILSCLKEVTRIDREILYIYNYIER